MLMFVAGIFYFMASSTDTLTVPPDPHSGGEGTVFNQSRDAFAKPANNLATPKLRDFTFGNKMFNTNWVQAPASVTTLDGLGPTFNRVSCSGCHFKDGRGRPPLHPDEPMNSMLLRVSVSGMAEDGGPKPHPAYGLQLNNLSITGVSAEGRATIYYDEMPGTYADGTPYSLRKPRYVFSEMNFGPMDDGVLFSPRVAPPMHGLGLLEAIPEKTILSFADPDDKDGDGISGRPNMVPNENGKRVVGRFGWKANVATLRLQDAAAAQGDIGNTTSLHPEQNCPEPQTACKAAVSGGEPEMSDEQLRKLVFYSQTLAVPARRHIDDLDVKHGAELFKTTQCAVCHRTNMKTGTHEVPELSNQRIQPYTDLLLHDMGDQLADHRPDYQANGNEWRTPPLWGIGLVYTVNGHTNFMHDGRARNLEEAILWHGGEAEKAKQMFLAMPKQDRAALLKFLDSL